MAAVGHGAEGELEPVSGRRAGGGDPARGGQVEAGQGLVHGPDACAGVHREMAQGHAQDACPGRWPGPLVALGHRRAPV